MSGCVKGCNAQALALLSVVDGDVAVGQQGYLLGKALLLRSLLLADAVLVGLTVGLCCFLTGKDRVNGFASLHSLFLSLYSGIQLFALLLLFGILFSLLFLFLFAGFRLGVRSREAFIDLFQEVAVIVDLFQVYLTVDIDGTLGVDGVAQTGSVLQCATSAP